MQTEVAPCSQDQNQKEDLIKIDQQVNKDDNQNQNEAMDIEDNHSNKQNSKKRKQKNIQIQPDLILNEKRQRKQPQTAQIYRDPSPQKIVEKKKQQKYKISSQMEQICTNIAKWEQFQIGLNQLGFPSIVLDEEKINDLLKDYDQKDDAGKEYYLKMLLRVVGEGLCCKNRIEINLQIKNTIEQLIQQKNIIINWTLEKWDEQIKSFLEFKAELSENIQPAQFFDFKAFQTLIGNNLPNYIEESKINITLVILKSRQIDDLKKVCDLNELKNIRLIREYLVILNNKIDQIKKLKEKINMIKKKEEEDEIVEQYNQQDSKLLEFKNTPIKFLQKTEIKTKPSTSQIKQKQKSQNLEKIENTQNNENEQINSEINVQTETNEATEKKVKDQKSNKKKEKEQQKQEKVIKGALDNYKFKKLEMPEIPNQQSKIEQQTQFEMITTPKDNNLQVLERDTQVQETNEPQQTHQNSQQQQQQQQQQQPQITGRNLKHFFFEKKQQLVSKQQEYKPKQLTPQKMEQFEALIEKMSNMQLQEQKIEVSLNDENNDEIEIQEINPQQQVRIRKIHIYIADSEKEFNGHQFVQLSQVIRPRAPFQQDDQIDYDKDSLDEVEEILAENLSDINDSDNVLSEESEQRDSFLVDDNHLSQDEVEDPEEILNNKCIANNTQVQNGIVYIKYSSNEPTFFENYKAFYISQFFNNLENKEQNPGTILQVITKQQQNNTKQIQIPKAKMNFSNNNQKKQNKIKKPKVNPTGETINQNNQNLTILPFISQQNNKIQGEQSQKKQQQQQQNQIKVDQDKIHQEIDENEKCEQKTVDDQQKKKKKKQQQNFNNENLQ
ncbi:unnamed protein product [Paramecium sonneborni]|uniref:Uncharacterized protein n=1 Tax=Paramecium sonneborni TaxID=65129 RepID=A0A8S1QJT0_9CILI|nr:unnamed protein product [Paramecium sonneborni]